MRNKKMLIALITAAVLLMTGFVFAETVSDRNGEFFGPGFGHRGFFGGMGGHHWRDSEREDWDRDDYREDNWDNFRAEGFRFGGSDHCYFDYGDREDVDLEEYREQWLEERYEVIDEALKSGEISEEEAKEYKEILEERALRFEEEGTFERGPGRGRNRSRGHMW